MAQYMPITTAIIWSMEQISFCIVEKDPYVLRVTFNCNKVPKYYDLVSKDFVDDKSGIAQCPKNKTEILDYCRKVYKDYDIVNIVHENMYQHFNNWCDNERKMCYFSGTSRVYRCVVGLFFGHAVSVPEDKHCKFDFVMNHTGPCKDEDIWVKIAHDKCRATGKNKVIHEYSPLEYQTPTLSKCSADQYQGIQFSCCNADKPKSNHSHHINFFPNGICDSKTFSHVRTSLLKRRNEKLQHTLMHLKKKEKASLSLRNTTAKSFLSETQKLLLILHRQHYVCAYKVISNKKSKILEALTKILNQSNINKAKLMRAVEKVMRVFGHEHHFLIRQFSHFKHLSPKEAPIRRAQDLRRLQIIHQALADVTNILQQFPDLQSMVRNFKKTLIIPALMFPPTHHNTDGSIPNMKPGNNQNHKVPDHVGNTNGIGNADREPVPDTDKISDKKGISTTAIVIIAGGCAIILVATVIIAAVIMKSNKEPENPMKVPLTNDFDPKDEVKIKCNSKYQFYDPNI
ncbi:uncharacterized protein TRIADDRAFT_55959 [Trichoplax adhaerens]|uniref:E1 domain-containing protein n=1 Tax=Trichoplax adhaerens TaxID=10228 RepID=B3RTK7_TRIAD|nr:hypothetical protein TRIADDRAFT_55959 [Trichoplax adhaerens]EDV25649.1 hypothetical protein TRIADDRAFT_55959 [Trichoplax adhaerens]|eukprot:XP_002111682.1 hypothetical protein TRIADDRAFT_55959 [Trichoplax adhaerens]